MSTTTLNEEITSQSRDTGIPAKELRRLCLQAGLEQLRRGELKITAKAPLMAASKSGEKTSKH